MVIAFKDKVLGLDKPFMTIENCNCGIKVIQMLPRSPYEIHIANFVFLLDLFTCVPNFVSIGYKLRPVE